MTDISPARIMEVGMAFWPAKVLLSAVKPGVFTTLGGDAKTGAELTDAIGLHKRANPDFFDTLVALRFLERDGDGPDSRYRNTAETALFLDKSSPAMSLNMLVEFGDAFDFSGADFDGWCRDAGFKRTEIIHLAGPASAGVAYK